ncbi:sensor histidine kinase, partial [Burkholderia sp. SIMBA_019]
QRDLAEMAELVEGSLSCARMQCSADEPMRSVDADSLLDLLIADYRDAGRIVTLDGRVGRPLVTCPHALRRVLVNLIDN